MSYCCVPFCKSNKNKDAREKKISFHEFPCDVMMKEKWIIAILRKVLKKKKKMYCRHCGSIWNSKNCKIRILQRMHRNRHIMKLQKMEGNEPWKLNKRQKQKLKKFEESRSKIVYNCFSCKKKTIFPGSKTLNNIKHKSVESVQKLNKKDTNAGLFIKSNKK